MRDRVLIVDDDPAICKLIDKVMKVNNIETCIVNSGAQALATLKDQRFDLVLLDVMLGDMEGFDVIHRVREDGLGTPIIIISGRNEDYDSVYGLSIGADDYVTKPFRPIVLGAKVKALFRRSRQGSSDAAPRDELLSVGEFQYNPATLRFYKNGKELVLSSHEASMFLLFLRNPEVVFSKNQLYEHVWGNSIIVDDNTVMVYINRLRQKIEDHPRSPKHIVNIRGVGYRFLP